MSKKINYTVGIDPGKLGAVAVMDIQAQKILKVFDTPIIKGEPKKGKKYSGKLDRYNLPGMWSILDTIAEMVPQNETFVVLEHAVAMPGQDASTIMKAGYGYGIWEMALVGMGFNHQLIYPITWAKALFDGLTEADTKTNSYRVAEANFPEAEFVTPGTRKKKPMDGRTDAMCIALYAARFMIQENK